MVKVFLHTVDIDRIKALMESLEYDGAFELEVDSSSGIGSVVKAHVPKTINCLKGTFTYIISAEENW
jgi:hypothetical protein